MRRTSHAIFAGLVLSVSAGSGCGSDPPTSQPQPDAGEQQDASKPPVYEPPPASTLVEDGAVKIRREVFLVPGVKPPKNPVATANAETPPELDYVRVVRYRVDASPPRPARAVAVMMPGFLSGAGPFDPLARAIVRRSTSDDSFEAWAIDRRGNLPEDHHGLDVAEVKRDPDLALGYYFEDAELEGKKFGAFKSPADMAFESEWGLATIVGDLRNVIGLVGAADRKSRVVLVGHSLGASIAEEYAAWDFNGAPGYDELAGMVLIDGLTRSEGDAALPVTPDEYTKGSGTGLLAQPGLDAIRASQPFIALPLLGLGVYPMASVVAMRSRWTPGEIVSDPYRDKAFLTLLALTSVPKMTNRAAMGLAFDNESCGVTFVSVSCGTVTGGPTEKYQSLLGSELSHPSDPDATYDWVEFDKTSPAENTSIDDIARAWYEGPGLDLAEWYFPARLALDVGAAGNLVLKAGDFLHDQHGLLAVHGAKMDLPIMGAVAGLVGDVAALDKLRALVGPVPIGPGRPLAGAARTDPDAFRVVDLTKLTHVDPIAGTDVPSGTIPTWHDTLVAWMKKNTPAGGVVVPVHE